MKKELAQSQFMFTKLDSDSENLLSNFRFKPMSICRGT